DYTTQSAIAYILLSLPAQIAQAFPMSALVGTLLGLGLLASRSELIVMRSVGWSIGDIIWAVMKLALVLVFFVWMLGEWVAPMTDNIAHHQKATALSQGQALATTQGTWLRDGYAFVHIQSIEDSHHLTGVTRYEFNEQQQLQKASFAKTAEYDHHHWVLHDIQETIFGEANLTKAHIEKQDWNSNIKPEIFTIVGVKDLDELSITGLWKTIRYRQANHLDAKPYLLAFWQKMMRPFATVVMMFLAIPFIFGPLRSATMGLRMLVGVMIGFVFFTINQLFGPLTLVYSLPPILGASLPTLLFLGGGLYLLKRTA
ncbi:MAG TPA: LPS export ABC transporter permease LptG, partial [Candidatus Berkiella sp.]|nr:LPS export ABC transporter permease LptG [Candidatus Berkiella sp.]